MYLCRIPETDMVTTTMYPCLCIIKVFIFTCSCVIICEFHIPLCITLLSNTHSNYFLIEKLICSILHRDKSHISLPHMPDRIPVSWQRWGGVGKHERQTNGQTASQTDRQRKEEWTYIKMWGGGEQSWGHAFATCSSNSGREGGTDRHTYSITESGWYDLGLYTDKHSQSLFVKTG